MNQKTKLGLLGATFLTAAFGMAAPAAAQDDTCPTGTTRSADGTCVEEEEAVVVTGSRLHQNAFTSASPVGVITAEEVTLEGLANTADIIQQNPATGGAFQVNTQLTGFVTTGGPGVSTIGLRGLGAQRTLVLLNGHRVGPAGTRGTVGPVDLNVIPSSMIERVEILKDGASSIYGSDAVAGVVNFITRTDLDGFNVDVYANANEQGGGEQDRISVSWGTTWDGGYFNIGAEYYDQHVLRNRDRDDLACTSDYLFVADALGHTTLPAEGARIDYANTDPGQTNGDNRYKCFNLFTRVLRAGITGAPNQFDAVPGPNLLETANPAMDLIYPDPGVIYPGLGVCPAGAIAPFSRCTGGNNSPVPGMVRQTRVGFPDTYPYAHQDAPPFGRTSAISPNELTTIAANAGFDLGDWGEVFSEFLWNRRESVQYGARQFFPGVSLTNPGNGLVGTPGLNSLLPIIPLKSDRDQTVDYMRGLVGVRGDIGDSGWSWEAFVQASHSDADYGTDIIYNDRVLATTGAGTGCNQAAITISGGVCGNLAAPIPWTSARILNGDFNPNERAFLFTHEVGNTTYDQRLVEGSVTGPIFELPAGALEVAVGASYREEEIDDTPGFNEAHFNLWGSTSAGRTFGSDTVSEYFAEAGIPLLRDAPFAQSLELSLSGRHVDYESYGEGDVYKIGLNWQVIPDFRIRATTGTSFRAPALYELYLANQTSFVGQTAIDPCLNWITSVNVTLQTNCAADGVPNNYTGAGTSSALVFAGGGAGVLKAEESEAQTVGIIWTPTWNMLEGFSMAVDYFDINVDNEIRQFGTANILGSCYRSANGPGFSANDPFCTLFHRNGDPVDNDSPAIPDGTAGPNAIQEVHNDYVNVAHQGNRGIDVTLRYERELGPGELTIQGEANFMLEDVTQIFLNGLVNDFLGTTQNFRGPEIVADAAIRYDVNDWTFNWAARFIGEGSDDSQFGGDTFRSTRYCTFLPCTTTNTVQFGAPTAPFVRFQQSVEPITYHDFSIRKRFDNETGADVAIILGMTNVFDERPPSQSSGQFRRGTAAINSYDLVGRQVFFNVSVAW
jgi:iron complex outermembrane receptor protein